MGLHHLSRLLFNHKLTCIVLITINPQKARLLQSASTPSKPNAKIHLLFTDQICHQIHFHHPQLSYTRTLFHEHVLDVRHCYQVIPN